MDDLIQKCICEGYEYQMYIWGQRDVADVELSDVFQKRMERLIRRHHQGVLAREIRRYAVSAAAVVGVIIILLRPGYVANAFDMIMEWFKDHVRIELEDGSADVCPRYSLGYIPEGYLIVEDVYHENSGMIVCANEDATLYFSYAISTGELNIDHEDATLEVNQLSDGTSVYCFIGQVGNKKNSATWFSEDKKVRFSIVGNVTIEEILKICEKISKIM